MREFEGFFPIRLPFVRIVSVFLLYNGIESL